MIVSASRRTDIPAFYAEWLMRRVRAGSCEVRNPYRPGQRSTVSLGPADVDCFVFWTRSPAGLLPYLAELADRGFRWYFLFTLLDYPPGFETHLPPLGRRLELLRLAAETTPPGGMVWRYDPIVLSSATPESFHLDTFERLARELKGTVDRVVVSFLDVYRKSSRALAEIASLGVKLASPVEHGAATSRLLGELAELAARHGMELRSCAEPAMTVRGAVKSGKCIDDELVLRLWGIRVSRAKDRAQRGECCCVASRDIGAYDTCLHGCRYCYATASREQALAAFRGHGPEHAALGQRE